MIFEIFTALKVLTGVFRVVTMCSVLPALRDDRTAQSSRRQSPQVHNACFVHFYQIVPKVMKTNHTKHRPGPGSGLYTTPYLIQILHTLKIKVVEV
jgi:hypothetical protein